MPIELDMSPAARRRRFDAWRALFRTCDALRVGHEAQVRAALALVDELIADDTRETGVLVAIAMHIARLRDTEDLRH